MCMHVLYAMGRSIIRSNIQSDAAHNLKVTKIIKLIK